MWPVKAGADGHAKLRARDVCARFSQVYSFPCCRLRGLGGLDDGCAVAVENVATSRVGVSNATIDPATLRRGSFASAFAGAFVRGLCEMRAVVSFVH